MDWRRIPKTDPLHDLIFYRVAEANPDMSLDELYDSRSPFVQEFDVYFGSRGDTFQYGEVDGAVQSVFGYGFCSLMALALNERLGREFVLWTTDKDAGPRGWSGHVGVHLDDSRVLDVFGISTYEDVARRYSMFGEMGEPEVVSREELLARTSSEDYREDPWSFVDELERLLTHDIAERLIAAHL